MSIYNGDNTIRTIELLRGLKQHGVSLLYYFNAGWLVKRVGVFFLFCFYGLIESRLWNGRIYVVTTAEMRPSWIRDKKKSYQSVGRYGPSSQTQ